MNQLSLFEEANSGTALYEQPQKGAWADRLGERLQEHAASNGISIPAISLFSGAGGLDIGFHDAGFDIQHAVEIERSFSCSIAENVGPGKYFGPNTQVHSIDIKEFDASNISAEFIIGGPPCQSFSAAGARAMGVAGTKDARGNLFEEYVRVLRQVKPRGFLFENVYRLLGANGGDDWNRIRKAFKSAGYTLYHRVLDTADYGVAQHRERLIVVGIENSIADEVKFRFPRPTHGPDSLHGIPHFSAFSAVEDVDELHLVSGLKGRYGHLLNEIPPGLNYSYFTEKMGHPSPIFAWRSKFSDFLYKADPSSPVRTIKAQGGQYTGPFHWDNRPFSVRELKRLQSFPDSYQLVGKRQKVVHQIGNSVPPQFARTLAISVLQQVFKLPIPLSLSYVGTNEAFSFRQRKRARTDTYRSAAADGLMSTPRSPEAGIQNLAFSFDVKANFEFNLHEGGKQHLTSRLESGIWRIDAGLISVKPENVPIKIVLRPKRDWIIPARSIEMTHGSSSLWDYVSLWKALDYLLSRYKLKADLVQLFGYYQYPSGVLCSDYSVRLSDVPESTSIFIRNVLSGSMVAQPYTCEEFGINFGIDTTEIPNILKTLKRAGYEVRSSRTNQAFETGSYMIPYLFPTLTPLSVQLNKDL